MEWGVRSTKRGGEEDSINSTDRLSDDTDFLIGHNISYHGNDSFLDTRSSTTTDLIYQQDITENDIPAFKQEENGLTNNAYSPGSNSPLKASLQYKSNISTDERKWDSVSIDKSDRKSDASQYSKYNSNIEEKLKSEVKEIQEVSYHRGAESENSKENVASERLDSPQKNRDNWKYRSLLDKSDDDSITSDKQRSGQKDKKQFAESFAGYLSDYDTKVKEGEELLARLLGKVKLNESLKSDSGINQFPESQKELSGKKKDSSNIYHGNVKPTNRKISYEDDFQKTEKESSLSVFSRLSGSSEKLMHLSNENEMRFEEIEYSSSRSSHIVTSDQSVVSRSSQRRGSSKEMMHESDVDAQSFQKQVRDPPSDESTHSHSLTSNKSSGSAEHQSIFMRANIRSDIAKKSSTPSKASSYLKGVANQYEQQTLPQWSDRDRYGIERRNLFGRKNEVSKTVHGAGEIKGHSSSSKNLSESAGSYRRQSPNANETGWPVSPIKNVMETVVKESEMLMSAKENDLKTIKLEIEQETLKKEAILREKKSAEESLHQLQMHIQSLEQLEEEHKKQTIVTRSELMEMEQQRNESQRKLSEVTEELNKQKKELESIPKELKESNIGAKISLLQDERDELKRECKIMREKCKDTEYLSSNNMDLLKKMRSLQEQLYNEQDSSREKCRSIREELEREKRKAVEANIEQLNSVRKLREEAMDAKKNEVNAAIERLEKGKVEEIELVKEKHQREVKSLQRRIEELEDENKRVVESNKERLKKIQDLTDNNLRRETEHLTKKLKKDKEAELQIHTQRHKREAEELQLRINAKQSEIDTLQAMLRQQEDSTRLLGEKLRNEAKDQICMAVEKERSSRLEELRETELELEKVKSERDALIQGNNSELDGKDRENERLWNVINKLKKELDGAKHETYEMREEKLQAVSKTRHDIMEEINKYKTKIRELERKEQSVLLEINEECLKTAAVTGNSYPMKKSYNLDDNSSTQDALASLQVSNNDLRKMFMMCKRRLDESRASDDFSDQQNRSGSDSVNEDSKTPESLKMVLGGSSEESKSARILRHLQSRVKQLRQGNQSMKKSFGSDEGDADGSINNSSLFEQSGDSSFSPKASKIRSLELAVERAEEQVQKYANLLSQKMAENAKLQKMLTHASKENIKLERLHAVLQQKMATGGGR